MHLIFHTANSIMVKEKVKHHMAMGPVKPLDIAAIEKITGMKGQEHNGQYKITIPQNDLKVVVDGFKNNTANGPGQLGCVYSFT